MTLAGTSPRTADAGRAGDWQQIRKFLQCTVYALIVALYSGSAAADSAAGATRLLQGLLDQYEIHGAFSLPRLTSDEIDDLLAGQPIVKDSMDERSLDGDNVDEMGIAAMQVLDAPRLLVWLAAMGVASEPDIRLTRAFLEHREAGAYVRYQHVNLPWPIRDRHWIILCEKNTGLASASNGAIWEHQWSLLNGGELLWRTAREDGRIQGLTIEDMEKSIYLAENRGAWIMLEVDPGRTLVIAFFDGDLGGRMPKSVVRRFSHVQLKNGLQLIKELSADIHQFYDERQPVHDGFGQPIGRSAVLELALPRMTATADQDGGARQGAGWRAMPSVQRERPIGPHE